jgi:hypothetical protein
MFGWFKKKPSAASAHAQIAAQSPGELFPWPKGAVLTAVDEVVIALPKELFDPDQPMGDFISASSELQISIPRTGEIFLIRLAPGVSASLTKSCDAYIVADDKSPRRIKVALPAD